MQNISDTNIQERGRQLEELHAVMRQCVRCPLYLRRNNVVTGEGNPVADVMLIGDSPGREDDKSGLCFYGRSGKILDRLLADLGLTREQVYLTNAIKCRVPARRLPHVGEIETCKHLWLERQIEIVDPSYIVLMGRFAAVSLLGKKEPLKVLRKEIHHHDGRQILITYHPSAALRFTALSREMKDDFKMLAKVMRKDHAIAERSPVV